MKLRFAICLLALASSPPVLAELPPDEVIVDVLPSKGMKYDPKAIERDDQWVLQGIFGTNGDDEISDLQLLPSKEIIAVGKVGDPRQIPAEIPRGAIQGLPATGNTFIALFDPALRKLQKVIFLPADIADLKSVRLGKDGAIYLGGTSTGAPACFVMKCDPQLRQLVWRANFEGQGVGSMGVLPDDSVAVATGGPFVSRVKADGSGLMPWGTEKQFRFDRANPQIQQKYWVDLGYAEKGCRDRGFLKGGLSDIGVTPDGNLAIMACNSINTVGGAPDFDAMLVKFTPEGEVLWVKNLAQGIPNEADNKYPRLHVDPYSSDLILSLTQHGSFGLGHDLVVTPGCAMTLDGWFTGDLMVGWIGRIDSKTGEVKAATMYFPDTRKPKQAGKSFAGSLFPEALATDESGRIYVIGAAAYKLATTKHAFQPESLGGSGFLTVFDPGLKNILYANLITAQGYSTTPKHLLVTETGPVVTTAVGPPKAPPQHLVTANPEKTNFLKPDAAGGQDVMFSLLPSTMWLMERDE